MNVSDIHLWIRINLKPPWQCRQTPFLQHSPVYLQFVAECCYDRRKLRSLQNLMASYFVLLFNFHYFSKAANIKTVTLSFLTHPYMRVQSMQVFHIHIRQWKAHRSFTSIYENAKHTGLSHSYMKCKAYRSFTSTYDSAMHAILTKQNFHLQCKFLPFHAPFVSFLRAAVAYLSSDIFVYR